MIYLIVIDTKCKECGYKNKGSFHVEEEMEIVCCGNCGKILAKPDNMTCEEEKQVEICVKEAMKDQEGEE